MKRALIMCLLLFICQASGNCATSPFPLLPPLQPLKPLSGDNEVKNYTSNVTELPDPYAEKRSENPDVNYLRINQVEKSLYGRTYNNQDITQRLARIEKSLFSKTYSNLPLVQRMDNIISNFNQVNQYPNISTNVLSRMETKVLSRTYVQSTTENRIERLEQKLFGAIQSGDIDARYEALRTAVNNYAPNNIYPNIVQNGVPGRRFKGLTSSLGNSMWGGTMTGYTPPIDPLYGDNYCDSYNAYTGLNNGYGMYQGNRTNHGYSDHFQSYGGGAGVTILD